jgi:hypothetical protein
MINFYLLNRLLQEQQLQHTVQQGELDAGTLQKADVTGVGKMWSPVCFTFVVALVQTTTRSFCRQNIGLRHATASTAMVPT